MNYLVKKMLTFFVFNFFGVFILQGNFCRDD